MDSTVGSAFLPPVFVLGVTQRSGTNYLRDLVCLHPDAAPRPDIPEDFLVAQAHHLQRYRDGIFRSWSPMWEPPPVELGDALLRHIGAGLMSWLASPLPGKRVVTKTPSVENIELLPTLLPDARFLLLVRDGRSVVESGVRSFGWRYPVAMRMWASAAQRVVDFDRAHRGGRLHYQVVRYEDVVDAQPGFITSLLTTAGLDPATFDQAAAHAVPLRGSSESRAGGRRPVHWEPVERPTEFGSLRRFAGWDAHRHAQFAAIAGPAQLALGYDLEPASSVPLATRVRNRCYDARPPVRRWRAELSARARRSR